MSFGRLYWSTLRRMQRTIGLRGMPRGCHVVSRELLKQLPAIAEFQVRRPAGKHVQLCCCSMQV